MHNVRMDIAPTIGAASALVGVVLGALLSRRAQAGLLDRTYRREIARSVESAYVDYVSSYRRIRLFVQANAVTVTIATRPEDPNRQTPVVEGAQELWDAVAVADSRLLIVDPPPPVRQAAKLVADGMWTVLERRASRGPGEVPDSEVWAAAEAEEDFAKEARANLNKILRGN
jgi:hypothetical protein